VLGVVGESRSHGPNLDDHLHEHDRRHLEHAL
jgi:hypothetical protein